MINLTKVDITRLNGGLFLVEYPTDGVMDTKTIAAVPYKEIRHILEVGGHQQRFTLRACGGWQNASIAKHLDTVDYEVFEGFVVLCITKKSGKRKYVLILPGEKYTLKPGTKVYAGYYSAGCQIQVKMHKKTNGPDGLTLNKRERLAEEDAYLATLDLKILGKLVDTDLVSLENTEEARNNAAYVTEFMEALKREVQKQSL